jgi:hypothetical protein
MLPGQIPDFCGLHWAYLLSCLTPMNEPRLLPGVPHFSKPHLRCLWPGFGQGRLARLLTCLIDHVCSMCKLLGCVLVGSSTILDMP